MHMEAIHQYIYFFQGHETLETSDNCLENIVNGLEFGAGVQMRAWVQITLILLLEAIPYEHSDSILSSKEKNMINSRT